MQYHHSAAATSPELNAVRTMGMIRLSNGEFLELHQYLGTKRPPPNRRVKRLRELHAKGVRFINTDVQRLCARIVRGVDVNRTKIVVAPHQFFGDIADAIDAGAEVRRIGGADGLFIIEYHRPPTAAEIKRADRPLRLTVELMSRGTWGQSCKRLLKKSSWDEIGPCDLVKHAGCAERLAMAGKLDFDAVVMHFCKVNRCRRGTWQVHFDRARQLWHERSRHPWRIEWNDIVASWDFKELRKRAMPRTLTRCRRRSRYRLRSHDPAAYPHAALSAGRFVPNHPSGVKSDGNGHSLR